MSRKILITGAEGQLGVALQRKFRDKFDIFPTDKFLSELGDDWSDNNLDITERDDVEYINLGSEWNVFRDVFFRAGFRQLGKSDSEESITLGLGAKFFLLNLNLLILRFYKKM